MTIHPTDAAIEAAANAIGAASHSLHRRGLIGFIPSRAACKEYATDALTTALPHLSAPAAGLSEEECKQVEQARSLSETSVASVAGTPTLLAIIDRLAASLAATECQSCGNKSYVRGQGCSICDRDVDQHPVPPASRRGGPAPEGERG